MFKKFSKEFLIHNNKDDQYHPSIIRNPNTTDFSVTWTNKEIGTPSTEIILKHRNTIRNTDNSVTDLVAVNGDFATNRMHSKTIYLTNGNQLVTWCSDMQDSSGFGVYATILEHSGSIVKEEFRINTHTASNQEFPSVVPLNGGFIIVWHSLGQDTKQITSGVFAKIFDSTGDVAKEEFQVNDYTANNQDHPVIIVLDNGNYVIAWQSFGQDGSGRGVYAKIYDHTNRVVREEFRVNTHTASNQEFPTLAKLADNKFIVVWQSNQQDGSGYGIYAKTFNSDGNVINDEFRINSYTEGNQKYPSVTMLSDGSFIIAWQSQEQDGASYEIYAKKYSREAVPIGEEFIVNGYTENNQERPHITALTDGSCAIVWQSFGQDGYKSSIYGQILTNENNTIYDDTNINGQTTYAPLPAEMISTTDTPTTIKPVPVSTVTPVTPVLETNTTKINTTLVPTVVPSHTDTTTTVETHASSTVQPTAIPTQILTEGSVITSQPTTSVPVATVMPQNAPTPTAIVTDTQISTGQSTFAPQPLSTLDSSTAASQPGSTETIEDTSKVPSSTNFVITDATVNATNVPTYAVTTVTATTTAPFFTNITSVLLNASSTLPINGSETGNNFIITSNVKEATIIAGSGVDTFIFEPSNNSIVYIDNFGNSDLLNLSNVTNVTSYDALNKTSGSTHFHLPYNQTVIIKNKYPHELNDSNVVLQNSLNNPSENTVVRDNSVNHNTTSETHSNAIYLIAGLTVGTVALIGGAIACTIAGIIIYRHKKAVAAVSAKIAETVSEHLPYGNEEEVSGSGVLSSSSDSSVIDMSGSGSMQEADLPGTVTVIG